MPARGHNWLANMNYNNGPYPKWHYSFDDSALDNEGFGGGAGLTYYPRSGGGGTQSYGNYDSWLSYSSKINNFTNGHFQMPNQSSGFNPFQKTYQMFVNFATSETNTFIFGVQSSNEKIQSGVPTPFGTTTNIYPGIQCYLTGYNGSRFGTLNFVIQSKNNWAPIVYRSVVSSTDWGLKPDQWHLLTIAVDGNPASFKQDRYHGYKVKIWIDGQLITTENLCSEEDPDLIHDCELPASTDTIFVGTSPRNTTYPLYYSNVDYFVHSFSIFDYSFDQASMDKCWKGLNHLKKWNENSQTWERPDASTWDANAATSRDMYYFNGSFGDWIRIPANQSKIQSLG